MLVLFALINANNVFMHNVRPFVKSNFYYIARYINKIFLKLIQSKEHEYATR